MSFYNREPTSEEIQAQHNTVGASWSAADTVGLVSFTAVCIFIIIAIVLVVKNINKQRAAHGDSTKLKYRQLETFALWRFSKVIFWVVVIAVSLFLMLYRDYYDHYTLARLGVALLVFSYPLYMLFRYASFYIAYGKAENKGKPSRKI